MSVRPVFDNSILAKASKTQFDWEDPLLLENELTEEEVIAVALYTGPMFMLYNAALRQAPAHIYNLLKFTKADGSEGTNCFPSTISALVSKSS